jgi:flagellar biosynthesis anti-sigma factor FlgM
MRVDRNGTNPLTGVLGAGTTDGTRGVSGGKSTDAGPAATGDTVALSGDAQFAARLRDTLNALPDIRADKVEEARLKLESGELGDPDALAARLIDDMLQG